MTNTEVFVYSFQELQTKELCRVFGEARVKYGATAVAARILKIKESRLRLYLAARPVPNLPGREVESLTIADVETRTKPQILRKLQFGRIQAVAHLGSNDAIARFLGMFEDQVRRIILEETKISPAAKKWHEERTKAWEALREG